ncbi:MAG TPA: CUAEP/CCAEP-tail radical SAM protein [Myxococcales bacterium]|nr:CUAEP/CCAEP-tail radical SAM protein [Myxococcales bacterium]
MRGPGEILIVSCYELGRQPVAAATALAELRRHGFAPAALDVSVEEIDLLALARARLVAISVPMHTALRLGVRVAQRVPAGVPVCFFGLYAELNAEHLLERHAQFVVGAESDVALRLLAEALERGDASVVPGVRTSRGATELSRDKRAVVVPSREGLPVLERYAHLEVGKERRLVASVEASRGCKHLCRHCPIVPVYRGRFVAVPRETVLRDVEQQIAAGARHVTFADPDFLNGPTHALRIVSEMHGRWPDVTFDATIKIEHLLQRRELLPELASCGCLFITSAVESLNDRVLAVLRKGHTAADVPVALRAVRAAGIDLRPTLLPYTPWTELGDLPALFDFAVEHDLLEQIDPVQYTLRLLIPPGSAVLEGDEPRPWLGALDPEQFGWSWKHPDPRVDDLWRASAAVAKADAEAGADPLETFRKLRSLADPGAGEVPRRPRRQVARLTEPWFC